MHALQKLLVDLNISTGDSFLKYFPEVRDSQDISVLRCQKSGIFVLSSIEHINRNYYKDKPSFSYWNATDFFSAVRECDEDTERRKELIKNNLLNKKWLEIGAGNGSLLSRLSEYCQSTVAVEPQQEVRDSLIKLGYETYAFTKDVGYTNHFDLVTLFHVFEHFDEPLKELLEIKTKMVDGGKILIEVPHANDFLIGFLDSDDFKKFTFWSEHLILHTRTSLEKMLSYAGFKNIVIKGVQRYPLANHLYWLRNKKPGGHVTWSELRSKDLDVAYENMLAQLDMTDTLIASATK